MTDNDDILIGKLFDEVRRKEIEDNGFSRRVMRNLPPDESLYDKKALLMSRLWTVLCTLTGIVLVAGSDVFGRLESVFKSIIGVLSRPNIEYLYYAPLLTVAIAAVGLWVYHKLDPDELAL